MTFFPRLFSHLVSSLCSLGLVCLIVGGISGCGQKGILTLPVKPSPQMTPIPTTLPTTPDIATH